MTVLLMSAVAKYGVRKRKRYVYKRRTPPSRWGVYKAAGSQLARDVLYLKTLINSEPHNHYVQSANNYNWDGIIVSLCDVPVGDAASERTGNRVLPRFLNVNVRTTFNGGSTYCRVMLFRYWGESASAAPAVTVGEVLRTTGTQFAPLTHMNEDITGQKGDRNRRIEVLRSVLLTLDGTEKTAETWTWDVEMNGMGVSKKEHMEWRSSATEEPLSGGLYMLFIGSAVGNGAYQLESKLVFYDN